METSSTMLNSIEKRLHKLKKNLVFQSKWAELNGAMGDLGTYIPIVLALTLAKGLNLGTTLIFTGFYNIVTGVIYGVPMPVQPMKSIAAAAIAGSDFGLPETMAAGICTGGILLVLGVTGLMQVVYKLIPLPVVRGIQLSQGLSFAMTAVKYVRNVQNFSKSKSVGERQWLGLDGLVLALVCACFIIIVNGAGQENDHDHADHDPGQDMSGRSPDPGCHDVITQHTHTPRTNPNTGCSSTNDDLGRKRLRHIITSIPSAFVVFLLGIVLAFARRPNVVKDIKFGPSRIEVVKISKHAWKKGFIKGTIPQLPLSVLNSVIGVCKLSTDLFPEKEISATSVSVTVGLMNMVGCWFGAMPCCHGAGGLAGQYKFGGRSGGCVVLLGAAKLVLGLVLGSSLARVLVQFPVGVLGILLLFAGIELAMASRDMNTKEESFVMLICTGVSVVGSSAALGFVCGIVVHLILRVRILGGKQSCSSIGMHSTP